MRVCLYCYVDWRGSESLLQLYILYVLDDIIINCYCHTQILQMVPNNFFLIQLLTRPHQVSNTRLGHTHAHIHVTISAGCSLQHADKKRF